MPYEVKLPDIGEGIAEGEIVRWLVKQGEAVHEDQPLVEVMTDKATVEIPSPRTGTIAKLHAEAGQVLPVGSVIVSIAVAGEPVAAATAAPANAEELRRWNGEGGAIPNVPPPTVHTSPAAPARLQATPAVRQLARQLGVELERVTGSGPGGTITAQDVRSAAGSAAPAAGATAAPAATAGDEERVPLRGLRRRIAEHMRRSLDTAAHFTFVAECDMTAWMQLRDRLQPRAQTAGVKLTVLAYVVMALVEPLRQFRVLNASLDDERGEIVLKRSIHVGIATHTTEGLMVPVLRDVPGKKLLELAREIERLAEGARAGRLALDELQGGTFTVTSTGAKGGVLATPILHHPQVAIMGVHQIKKRPAVVDDRIVARDLGNLSLSLDHRVVDGAVGADFLYAVIERLEHPEAWLRAEDIG